MYRRPSPGQLSFEDFYLPFGGQLSADNRWVRLASIMPWEQFESSYVEQLSAKQGAPAKSFRMALGALIIQEHLGLSDRETVQQVRENPYLQYFLGFHEYQYEAAFDGSMMMSLTMGLIDEQTGLVYFVNAGHPRTILYRQSRAVYLPEQGNLRKVGVVG